MDVPHGVQAILCANRHVIKMLRFKLWTFVRCAKPLRLCRIIDELSKYKRAGVKDGVTACAFRLLVLSNEEDIQSADAPITQKTCDATLSLNIRVYPTLALYIVQRRASGYAWHFPSAIIFGSWGGNWC